MIEAKVEEGKIWKMLVIDVVIGVAVGSVYTLELLEVEKAVMIAVVLVDRVAEVRVLELLLHIADVEN